MNDPRHPVGPAFDKAADALAGWRKQQLAALTPEQRQEHDHIAREQGQQLRDHDTAYQDHLYDLIDAEKRRILERKPDLALRMLPGARMKDARAEYLAKGVVLTRHENERKTMEQDHRQHRDNFLQRAEQERRQQPDQHHDAQPVNDNKPEIPAALAAAFRARALQQDRSRDSDRGREL